MDKTIPPLYVRLDHQLRERLRAYGYLTERTHSEIARLALDEYLTARERKDRTETRKAD